MRPGKDELRIESYERDEWGSKTVIYIFCSEAHKRHYLEQVRQQHARHPLGNIRRF